MTDQVWYLVSAGIALGVIGATWALYEIIKHRR